MVPSPASVPESSDAPGPRAIHHIGITVRGLDRSLAFWEAFLGHPARWRRVLDASYLGRVVSYPGIRIEASVIDLPGGAALELLQYLDRTEEANDPATARPGNVHVCLLVDDIEAEWQRAVSVGARPVSKRPVSIDAGPNTGARAVYLRDPDGVTIELFQAAPRPNP